MVRVFSLTKSVESTQPKQQSAVVRKYNKKKKRSDDDITIVYDMIAYQQSSLRFATAVLPLLLTVLLTVESATSTTGTANLVVFVDAFSHQQCQKNGILTKSSGISRQSEAISSKPLLSMSKATVRRRMHQNTIRVFALGGAAKDDNGVGVSSEETNDGRPRRSSDRSLVVEPHLQSRGQVLKTLLLGSATAAAAAAAAGILTASPSSAQAFDRNFPMELTEVDEESNAPVVTTINGRSSLVNNGRANAQQRKRQAELKKTKEQENLVNFNVRNDLAPSAVWGGALWLLSGSRSNPLATPLANVIYGKDSDEPWLRDRNAGLFASPPPAFLAVLGIVFLALGTLTQLLLLQLAEGDNDVVAQLAGVALINGVFFEIGRIASGDKRMTRDELDRELELKQEFEEFAEQRLVLSGNCHRSDVVKSFRRYHAKYRQADSEEYPLADLEIERLLRAWNQINNQGKAEMTSAGFYYGISINTDADVFA